MFLTLFSLEISISKKSNIILYFCSNYIFDMLRINRVQHLQARIRDVSYAEPFSELPFLLIVAKGFVKSR